MGLFEERWQFIDFFNGKRGRQLQKFIIVVKVDGVHGMVMCSKEIVIPFITPGRKAEVQLGTIDLLEEKRQITFTLSKMASFQVKGAWNEISPPEEGAKRKHVIGAK